ncbi:hypothetical protein [Photobacterium leiognathi]|nr:hypothetical protein [Photobacterium leiognathi]
MDIADIAKADAKAQLIIEQARQAVIESKQALLKDNPAQSEEIKTAFNELHDRVALYKQ